MEKQNVKVLVSRIFPDLAVDLLEKAGFSVTAWNQDRPMTSDELICRAKQHDVLLCTLTDKIDRNFLNICSHLKIISQYAVGYDNIDIVEATKIGIPVGYTPGAMSDATADIAFGLMIAVSRKMFYLHKTILKKKWRYFRPTKQLGFELKNKTLGIFGMGRIGMEMAKRCKGAYNMDVIYYNRKVNRLAKKDFNAKQVSFNDLLEQSDILSVHCSLNKETHKIFDKSAFNGMKQSAIFINTSRGPVHNEVDLIEALNSGRIWGAGLDVTDPEPMQSDNPLLSMENVAVLPHVGSGTMEARDEMARLAALNIIDFFKNKKMLNIVNPDVFI
jgi:glyoxylate reductase